MKKSRKLLMILGIVLSLAVATGTTLAYLTDTDSDVNVMTLGNVDITQLENGEAENGFENGQPLYPAYYEDEIDWETNEGVVDKEVTVENTGKSDAYVRTWFAFEAGKMSYEDFQKYILLNIEDSTEWTWEWDETKTYAIENENGEVSNYYIAVATREEALPAGVTSGATLLDVAMSKEATNEIVEAMGEYYTVLVMTQAVQVNGFEEMGADAALAEGFGDEEVANGAIGVNHPWDEGFTQNYPVTADTWDGTADTSWYNDTDTEFMIMTAEQLAGFGKLVDEGKTFEGKTVKVGQDIDLYLLDENGEPVCFEPIGSYRFDKSFKGTFDGQNHTISNLSQNTWALNNGYYYNDCGLGLFGAVEEATIKDLVMDGASISGESAICGTVAAVAGDNCVFENITVKNSNIADYQYYAGGIVGWASGDQKYINCDIDASTTIGSQWGDFNNCSGGIIGGTGTSGKYHFEDCDVACVIDAVNDVVSTYHWYCYRNAGMLIGNTGSVIDEDGNQVGDAYAPNVTCKNVTVTYDDWANYTYCEFGAMGEKYAYVRVQSGLSVDAYSNVRYGHPTDANGDTVTDENHAHNDGESHHELHAFDQLFGGKAGDRYCYYGSNSGTTDPDATIDGVTIIYNNK